MLLEPRRAVFLGALAFVLAAQGQAVAQTSPAGAPQISADAIAQAKELFREGVALFGAGEIERALDAFRRSQAIVPSKQNTLNVAICLDRLGRFDEAVDAYGEVVARYAEQLSVDERASIPSVMATLRQRLAAIDVSGNVSGAVVVDGRERAKLPSAAPIRVLPGPHVVRVLKDGYKSFEVRVELHIGEVRSVDARLEPLSAAGGLRVEDTALPGAEVTIDGVRVGVVPWEGTLAPGPHVVSSYKQNTGSAPTLAVVLQGQTTLLRLRSAPLGPSIQLDVTPASAELRLNAVPLARGHWEGSVPPGSYEVEAAEDGYFSKRAAVVVRSGEGGAPRTSLVLDVDTRHPRWPKAPPARFLAGAFLGAGISPSLHGGAERCDADCDRGLGVGGVAGVRTSYELPVRVSLELTGGYLSMRQRLSRHLFAPFSASAAKVSDYAVDDEVHVRGWFVGPGLGYRVPLAAAWSFRSRAGAGIAFLQASDTIRATSRTDGAAVSDGIENNGASVTSSAFFASFELGVERVVGAWRLGLSLAAFVVPFGDGPALPTGAVVTPRDGCTDASPSNVGCVRASTILEGERGYGPFLLILPQLTATWSP